MPFPQKRLRWEVTLPANNIKVLSHALTCLNKIGKELLIDVSKPGEENYLNFRTLNDGKSAFCAFRFDKDFFDTVEITHNDENDEVSMAAALPLAALTKLLRGAMGGVTSKANNGKISRLRIALEEGAAGGGKSQSRTSYVVFQFEGVLGERRRHRFLFNEQDALNAVFDTSLASNIVAQPQQLHALLEHLQTSDVSLLVSATKLKVRSYHSSNTEKEFAMMNTEMSVSSQEFDSFDFTAQVSENGEDDDLEIELAFGLKELKALIGFSIATASDDLKLLFIDNGLPVQVFSNHRDGLFSAELFLSTMQTDEEAPNRILLREQMAEERHAQHANMNTGDNNIVYRDQAVSHDNGIGGDIGDLQNNSQVSQNGYSSNQQHGEAVQHNVAYQGYPQGNNMTYHQSQQYSQQQYQQQLQQQQYQQQQQQYQQQQQNGNEGGQDFNMDPFGTDTTAQNEATSSAGRKKKRRRHYRPFMDDTSSEGSEAGDAGGLETEEGRQGESPRYQDQESIGSTRLSLNSETSHSVVADTPQRRLSQITPYTDRYGKETPTSSSYSISSIDGSGGTAIQSATHTTGFSSSSSVKSRRASSEGGAEEESYHPPHHGYSRSSHNNGVTGNRLSMAPTPPYGNGTPEGTK